MTSIVIMSMMVRIKIIKISFVYLNKLKKKNYEERRIDYTTRNNKSIIITG
jgi:hypothetical protein